MQNYYQTRWVTYLSPGFKGLYGNSGELCVPKHSDPGCRKMTAFWDVAPCSLVDIQRRYIVTTASIMMMIIIITLMIGAASSPETLASIHDITRFYVPKCSHLQTRRINLISHIYMDFLEKCYEKISGHNSLPMCTFN
jgi:hypothetical protein